jgi:hypothetical protein
MATWGHSVGTVWRRLPSVGDGFKIGQDKLHRLPDIIKSTRVHIKNKPDELLVLPNHIKTMHAVLKCMPDKLLA